MKKLFLLILLLISSPVYAADFYIAQSAAGSGNGTSCANAHAIAGLTWNGGDINDGDTLHLCGTLTSTLTIGDSGQVGLPYTIKFEDGAKFSKAYWGTDSNAAIYGSGKGYITIDGGTNGIIENTDNGTAGTYTNQESSKGIYLTGCNNIEIKNLTVRNIYIKTSTTDASTGAAASWGLDFREMGSNVSVHDSTIYYTGFGMNLNYSGAVTNWNVYNNTLTYSYAHIYVAPSAASSSLTGLYIYNNTSNLTNAWTYTEAGDPWHGENIHTHNGGVVDGTVWINNVYIYNNSFGPTCPMRSAVLSMTSSMGIRWAAPATNLNIYNNTFLADDGYWSTDAMITLSGEAIGTTGLKIMNNTFDSGPSAGVAIYIGLNSGTDTIIKNNVVLNGDYGVLVSSGSLSLTSPTQIDYNVYEGATKWMDDEAPDNWATWTGHGYDEHSTLSAPTLDANYVPTAADSVARDQGVDLSGSTPFSTADKYGNPRPYGAAWDIGAYEYGAGGTQIPSTVKSMQLIGSETRTKAKMNQGNVKIRMQ